MRVLLIGETWTNTPLITNGVDSFFARSAEVDSSPRFREALKGCGIDVTHLPTSRVNVGFPDSDAELDRYDAVVLGDIGSRSLLLHPDMYATGGPAIDRCAALAEYVHRGGGLLMIGGYLSFSGYSGMAAYSRTALADILPVRMSDADDTVERPSGSVPRIDLADHPIVADLPTPWPPLLGYNRVTAAPSADVVATIDGDPLVIAGSAGLGRSAAFTSDCAPHWASTAFMAWAGYSGLMSGLVRWVAGESLTVGSDQP